MASIATSSAASRQLAGVGWGRFARVALATIVAAPLANVLVYALGSALIGYDPRFPELGSVIGIAIFTLVPALVAALLYAALLHFARRPARTFVIVAAMVFTVTLIPDLTFIPTQPGATAGQTAILMLMHAVAATIITVMLTGLARPLER